MRHCYPSQSGVLAGSQNSHKCSAVVVTPHTSHIQQHSFSSTDAQVTGSLLKEEIEIRLTFLKCNTQNIQGSLENHLSYQEPGEFQVE